MHTLNDRVKPLGLALNFLKHGSFSAISMVLAGLVGFIFVYTLGRYEPAVLAAYGVALSFISIPILMMGIQFLFEPFPGFFSAALKILVRPSATVGALMVSLWRFALPVIGILFVTSTLTLVSLWSILLLARLGFCLQTIRLFRKWKHAYAGCP